LTAQEQELSEIQNFDLSNIWTTNGSTDIDYPNSFISKRPDPLGFIGDDYQRIDVRIDEVIKNERDPLTYFVRGSSTVKKNRCSFMGIIKINSADIQDRGDYHKGADYNVDMETVKKRGIVYCTYQFYENKNQKWTGYFSGDLTTKIYINTANEIKYDAIRGFSDSYMNNSFEGTWTSYSTKKSKNCNWGEFRIPNSGDLNIGAGEFSPNPKYLKNGWDN
jgi:hypothetical protein